MTTKIAAILIMVTGCGAEFTHGIRPNETYDRLSAYVYGRFHITREGNTLFSGDENVGFEIICRDGSKYTIGFSERQSLQVIKVAPSKCQLDYVLYTDGGGVRVRDMAAFRLLRNEFLDPGGVYYVGDFVAGARTTVGFSFFYSNVHTGWAFAKVQGRYERTTEEMKVAFPALASVPTENRVTR